MIDAAPSARILLVEDDARLAELLVEYLAGHGFDVRVESDGAAAIQRFPQHAPDVVVLDLMLPGASGFEVCRKIRERHKGGILMLTASKVESDHVTGLELGADDFVTKPVEPRILLARIQSLVRRISRNDGPRAQGQLVIGALHIDREVRSVRVGERQVELTGAEFGILWMLADNVGFPVTREALHAAVLGTRWTPLDRGLDAHLSRIRKKLGDVGFDASAIQSVRGEGYRLVRR